VETDRAQELLSSLATGSSAGGRCPGRRNQTLSPSGKSLSTLRLLNGGGGGGGEEGGRGPGQFPTPNSHLTIFTNFRRGN